jgi:molybdopterin-containing oxidoreductase family iron-sulfur binding subunit
LNIDRRVFLKLGGLAIVGIVARPAFDAVSRLGMARASVANNNRALTAGKWAMFVDLEACRWSDGCRECLDACHRVHNVPDFPDPKDEIKWIWTVSYEQAFPDQEHEFLTAEMKDRPAIILCNHCDDPPCVPVCPTQATFKREDGIVMMDYHRCIGCRYCMAACPYGARSFNWRDPRPFINELDTDFPTRTKGVVEKCNFCQERLARGLFPACVEACKEGALQFGDLDDPASDVREALDLNYSIRRKPWLGTEPKVYYGV